MRDEAKIDRIAETVNQALPNAPRWESLSEQERRGVRYLVRLVIEKWEEDPLDEIQPNGYISPN